MAWNAENLFLSKSGVSGGPNHWVYRDTATHTDVDADGYLATAVKYGMKVGDVVLYQETDNAYATTLHSCRAVSGDTASISLAILA